MTSGGSTTTGGRWSGDEWRDRGDDSNSVWPQAWAGTQRPAVGARIGGMGTWRGR